MGGGGDTRTGAETGVRGRQSQGMPAASRSRRGKEAGSPLELPEGTKHANISRKLVSNSGL